MTSRQTGVDASIRDGIPNPDRRTLPQVSKHSVVTYRFVSGLLGWGKLRVSTPAWQPAAQAYGRQHQIRNIVSQQFNLLLCRFAAGPGSRGLMEATLPG